MEVMIENLGNADCSMKEIISIRPSTSPDWTEISVIWEPLLLRPGDISKITFKYEWAKGLTYFIKVLTEKGLETMAYGKAP